MSNTILKVLSITSLIAILTACGAADSSDNSTLAVQPPAGIYMGTITCNGPGCTTDQAVAVITSTNKIVLMDVDSVEGAIGTINNGVISGLVYTGLGVGTLVSTSITSVNGNSITGVYASTINDVNGTFSLVANPNLYNRGASLSKLVGTWVDTTFTDVGISTWVIASDGSFDITTTLDCSGTGNISLIDSTKNEYSASITVTNCPGLNGSHTGIAVISDTHNTDDTLSLVFSSGSIAFISEPVKQ